MRIRDWSSDVCSSDLRNTRELGGGVILHGETLADAHAFLEAELIGKRGMTLVHPYDDTYVIAGQGTVALEMLEQVPELDTLIVPVGGGGLISGMETGRESGTERLCQ